MIDNQPIILVADDDALIRKAMVRTLAAAGYTIIHFRTNFTSVADGNRPRIRLYW